MHESFPNTRVLEQQQRDTRRRKEERVWHEERVKSEVRLTRVRSEGNRDERSI